MTKTNFISIGDNNIDIDKLGSKARLASNFKKLGWAMEKGCYQMPPSWGITYGKSAVDEEQLACLGTVNEQYRALIRKSATGAYERPSHLPSSLIYWAPDCLPGLDIIEELSAAEIREYSDKDILPPHVSLRIDYPIVPFVALGHIIIADTFYRFPNSTSYGLGMALGEAKFNITPLIYADAGLGGLDPHGYRAVSFATSLQGSLAPLAFQDVTRTHLHSTIKNGEAIDAWAVRALQLQEHDTTHSDIDKLFKVTESADTYAFHGVMTAEHFSSRSHLDALLRLPQVSPVSKV